MSRARLKSAFAKLNWMPSRLIQGMFSFLTVDSGYLLIDSNVQSGLICLFKRFGNGTASTPTMPNAERLMSSPRPLTSSAIVNAILNILVVQLCFWPLTLPGSFLTKTPPKLPTDELEDAPKFWAKFGGKPKSIAPETTDEGVKCADRLYKLSNEKGSLTMTLVGEGELDSKMLDTNDIFLLDAGFQIYTWVGKNANSEEKAAAMT